mmetsp:Transcript_49334/g.116234  ORF Transcript_49334/g.116234 Transcript_49334/m.116234 type:complete len:203 (+) Transcript_49334:246-854(+)
MIYHNHRTATLAVFILAFGCVDANFCCKKIHWGSDWCHRDDCLGSGCYPGDKSISCSNIGECICRDFIHDTTKAFCTTLESCRLASEDVAAAMFAVELYTSTTASEACIHALVRGVCAYHFPVCISDNEEYSQICSETCEAMETECGITFAYFASVPDRCQQPNVLGADECTAAGAALLPRLLHTSLGAVLVASIFAVGWLR